MADKKSIDTAELKKITNVDVKTKNDVKGQNPDTKEKYEAKDLLQFSLIGEIKSQDVLEYLTKNGFEIVDV